MSEPLLQTDNDIELLAQALARTYLIDFITTTMPTYEVKWYHELLCNYLDRLVAGEINRLMVFMPPQHGKSQIVSRHFPAYILGKNPKLSVAGCSYSADLSSKFNREVQRLMEGESYAWLFPETRLNGKNIPSGQQGSWLKNSEIFEIVGQGGSYKSVGVGGPLTGNKVDIGIIDDPIKDRLDAQSDKIRQRVWEWYTDVFMTRMHNDSKILLTMTRWHEDDLAGRILAKERDKWAVLSIPALKEDNLNPDDPREVGDALWPERHDLDSINSVKKSNERTFVSMYQQRPAPAEGNIFKKAWFQYYPYKPNRFDKIIMSWDCTFKDSVHSDFVVGQVWGKLGARAYVLDMVRGQWGFVDTVKEIKKLIEKWPECSEKLIEDKANGTAVIEVLKKQIPGLIAINPTESKEARANAVSYVVEAGNVFLPESAEWKEELILELTSFPNAKHDDITDAFTQALNRMFGKNIIDYSKFTQW